MLKTFNCGIGYTVVVPPTEVLVALGIAETKGVAAFEIGRIQQVPESAVRVWLTS